MKLAIGSDHGGFPLKETVKAYLQENGHDVTDLGCFSIESVDYPDFALKVAQAVASGVFEKGILMCGTGIGISISANKVKGIRAALCHDHLTASLAARHNNANILCMGGRTTGPETAKDIVDAWLNAPFEGGRHKRRLAKIAKMECKK
ncbi:MAG: ribose 5-phosphate isomerase B [Acidobacteria bacterium]|nr:ribose 5-phosphate isomerase B [Acidobacteriota bacterium]